METMSKRSMIEPFGIEFESIKLLYLSCIKCGEYLHTINNKQLINVFPEKEMDLPLFSGANFYCEKCNYYIHLEIEG